jgi:uncharacterized membrane protein
VRPDPRSLIAAGVLIGIGLGGFLDGIALHQLAQTHHMLTARYPTAGVPAEVAVVNLQINTFWDGLFHAGVWVATLVGVVLLYRATGRPEVPRSGKALAGSLLLGWGLFNLVEGVIDHHLLHVHHVTETPDHLLWDVLFLLSGVALMSAGGGLIRSGLRAARLGPPPA